MSNLMCAIPSLLRDQN